MLHDLDVRLRLGAHRIHGWTVVIPIGEIDLGTRQALDECLERCDGDVIVDLAGVAILDASAMGVLVAHHERLCRAGGSLVLREPRALVRRALHIGGLEAWIA